MQEGDPADQLLAQSQRTGLAEVLNAETSAQMVSHGRHRKLVCVLVVLIHAQCQGISHLNVQTALAIVTGLLAVAALNTSIDVSNLEEIDAEIADMTTQ